jgi:hypothetical protein
VGCAGTVSDAEGTAEEAGSGPSEDVVVKAHRDPDATNTTMFNTTRRPAVPARICVQLGTRYGDRVRERRNRIDALTVTMTACPPGPRIFSAAPRIVLGDHKNRQKLLCEFV